METKLIIRHGAFGHLHIYRQTAKPQNVIFFLSGARGWDRDAAEKARTLASLGALVVGIDTPNYIAAFKKPSNHDSVRGNFVNLAGFVEKHYHYDHYIPPILVGDSAGATIIYLASKRTSTDTFQGRIGLNFCPAASLLALSNTKGSEKITKKETVKATPEPWFVIQDQNSTCPNVANQNDWQTEYNAQAIILPSYSSGIAEQNLWLPPFINVFHKIIAQIPSSPSRADSLSDLPLKVAATVNPKGDSGAVFISGDGGWAGIEQTMAQELNRNNISVVGIDSPRYFWNPKSVAQASHDLSRILAQYSSAWRTSSFILIGYSRGADVLPFMVSSLPEVQKKQIKAIVLLSPGKISSFDFHIMNWIRPYLGKLGNRLDISDVNSARPLIPEMTKLTPFKVECVYGAEEDSISLCSLLDPEKIKIIKVPGGHHFDGDYKNLLDRILLETGA